MKEFSGVEDPAPSEVAVTMRPMIFIGGSMHGRIMPVPENAGRVEYDDSPDIYVLRCYCWSDDWNDPSPRPKVPDELPPGRMFQAMVLETIGPAEVFVRLLDGCAKCAVLEAGMIELLEKVNP